MRIRRAVAEDVPTIHQLIRDLALYERALAVREPTKLCCTRREFRFPEFVGTPASWREVPVVSPDSEQRLSEGVPLPHFGPGSPRAHHQRQEEGFKVLVDNSPLAFGHAHSLAPWPLPMITRSGEARDLAYTRWSIAL